jgi:hypothetical protein
MSKKLAGVLLGALVGYMIEQAAAEGLRSLGIPPKAARFGGALLGALII